jgi:hypothetical protein
MTWIFTDSHWQPSSIHSIFQGGERLALASVFQGGARERLAC